MTKSKQKTKLLLDEAARRGYLRIFTDHATGESKRLWDAETLLTAVGGGDLDLLKFLRSKDPPCPWHEWTCYWAAEEGHLEVLKWSRSQDPPCPWSRLVCREEASLNGHQHVVDWIDQRGGESDDEEYREFSDMSFDSYGELQR